MLYIAIVLLLIAVEGVFVAAEIALVSLREGQVRALAESGRRGAAVARLVSDPNRFLAAVQIGVTSTALLSSAFGAVTLSDEAKQFLVRHGWSDGLAGATGIIGVTLIISFVTLVVGELAPKRLGLQRAEAAATFFAPPLNRIAGFFRPIIWLLSKATNLLVRLLGGDPGAARAPISQNELRGLVAAHEALSSDERRLIDDVFAAGERAITEIMVPRTEVTFLEAGMTVSRAAKIAGDSPHSRYPVVGTGHDDVLGFVHIRDLLLADVRADRDRTVGSVAREVKALPGSKHVLSALSEMRREGHHLAIVVDEYGGTDGIVSLEDLVEEIVGDIHDHDVHADILRAHLETLAAAHAHVLADRAMRADAEIEPFKEQCRAVVTDDAWIAEQTAIAAAIARTMRERRQRHSDLIAAWEQWTAAGLREQLDALSMNESSSRSG
ncbi:MAG: hypothetical protein DLM57_04115 [Pseudonocardiales bacterium]|nr:MAG: hypothetical protein DLM57_04115 [Pseudonocardiales bacterium]